MDNEMNTVVETVEDRNDVLLRDQLSRLSVEALRVWLGNFGYEVKEDVGKQKLIESIAKLHKEMIKKSEETVAEAVNASDTTDDPVVDIIFENIESPGTSIEFCYQPPNGTFRVENGKVRPAPKWSFYPGRKYKVPYSIYKHLNSLKVPADKVVNADDRGFIQNLYSGAEKQNRFSCRLELTDDDVKRLNKG